MQIDDLLDRAKSVGIDYVEKISDREYLFEHNVRVRINPDQSVTVFINITPVDIYDSLITPRR